MSWSGLRHMVLPITAVDSLRAVTHSNPCSPDELERLVEEAERHKKEVRACCCCCCCLSEAVPAAGTMPAAYASSALMRSLSAHPGAALAVGCRTRRSR